MKVVAVIPARAGSKRLPGKNLRPLAGRPLIEHTCRAALDSGVLDAVYVDTDGAEIETFARACGVQSLGLRPPELATDEAPTRDAVVRILHLLTDCGERFDAVMLLQPTSPLRSAEDIRAAWALFLEHAPCEVVGVAAAWPRSWMGTVAPDGRFERWTGDDLVHRVNGALYIHRIEDYLKSSPARCTIAYIMPAERSVDIDTAADLALAEALLAAAGRGV